MLTAYRHYDPPFDMSFDTYLRTATLTVDSDGPHLTQICIPDENLSLENLTENSSFDGRDLETELPVHVEFEKDRMVVLYIDDEIYVDQEIVNISYNEFSDAIKDIYNNLANDALSWDADRKMDDRAWVASLVDPTINPDKELDTFDEEINYLADIENALLRHVSRSQEPMILAATSESPEQQSDFEL